jgi:hypothetical protein
MDTGYNATLFLTYDLQDEILRVGRDFDQHQERVPQAGITPTEQERKPATVDGQQARCDGRDAVKRKSNN